MKKILFFAICISIVQISFGQQKNAEKPIERDTAIRTGVLENGMTYYVRHNNKPANMADFYILHDVGAAQEEDNQNGLAHFLEHMAFNGTKNYPNKNLIEYLESIGVQFGANLNAGTGQQSTVYMMKDVPLKRGAIIDSALLILNDWSHYISLLPEEIASERGVILEEMRTGTNASRRMFDKQAPLIFNNTILSKRLVIGTEEILKNFTPQDIRDFYNSWYRTDMQAVVVVGDFDADKMEQQVKELFSKIPAVKDAKPKQDIVIPPYEEDKVLVLSDPEWPISLVSIYYPLENYAPKQLNNSYGAIERNLKQALFEAAINERLADMAQMADAPFLDANIGVTERANSNYVLAGSAVAKEGELPTALNALAVEIERVQRFGLPEDAIERARAAMLKSLQVAYENRNDVKNGAYVSSITNNFFKNTPIPSAEQQHQVYSEILNRLTMADVNAMKQTFMPDVNVAIIASVPEKEGVKPTEEALIKAYKEAKTANIEVVETSGLSKQFISSDISAGKIVSTTEDAMGATVWTLSNGAKVVVKPTKFKQDEILLSVYANGGYSILPTADLIDNEIFIDVMNQSGLGDFSARDISKMLSGKSVNFKLSVNRFNHGISASSSTTDLETLLQLVYLQFSAPRFTQSDFDLVLKNTKIGMDNYKTNPDAAFSDSLAVARYGASERNITTDIFMQNIDKTSLDGIKRINDKLFGSATSFVFTIVGNVNLEAIKPLVEKYIASIKPGEELSAIDDKMSYPSKDVENTFSRVQENPKSKVSIVYVGDNIDYNLKNIVAMDALVHVLRIKYTEIIREEMGATYGVGVGGSLVGTPVATFSLASSYDTNAEATKSTSAVITEQLQKAAKGDIDPASLSKAQEVFLKNFENGNKENSVWMSRLIDLHQKDIDRLEYPNLVKSLTVKDVANLAKEILNKGTKIEVIMLPEVK